MAVNVGQRHVPDNPQNRQLGACQKALDLALHTIKLCCNEHVFIPEYREAITNSIIDCAKGIYLDVWTGNGIYVTLDNGRWKERVQFQRSAMVKCGELLGLINISKRLFHLKGNKVKYWSEMTLDTLTSIRKWNESTINRYGT